MALIVDFLLPRQPVSHQTKTPANRVAWQDYVFGRAMQVWAAKPLKDRPLKFTLVYVTEDQIPGDINNFVKPVQDALNGLIYADDSMIIDVSAHMRRLYEPNSITGLPLALGDAILASFPCVYVAISDSVELSEVLT